MRSSSKKYVIIGFILFSGLLGLLRWNTQRTSIAQIHTTPSTVATTTSSDGSTSTVPPTSAVVDLAPDFTLDRLDGGKLSLSDYRGEKPVVLDFWASWCPNCQRDMPKLSALYDEFSDEVEVIGINLRESTSTVQRFIDSRGITFPIVMDKGSVSRQYGIRYTNTHVLINTDGSVAQIVPGDISRSHITALIEANR